MSDLSARKKKPLLPPAVANTAAGTDYAVLEIAAPESKLRAARFQMDAIQAAMLRIKAPAPTGKRSLRRYWNKLRAAVRRLLVREAELLHMDASLSSVWNRATDRFRLTVNIVPDLWVPGAMFIDGWVLAMEGEPVNSVRLLLNNGGKWKTKCSRSRQDVPQLYPEHPGAEQCGFRFSNIEGAEGHAGFLEARSAGGAWHTLAAIRFSSEMTIRCVYDIQKITRSMLFDCEHYLERTKVNVADETWIVHQYLLESDSRCIRPNRLFDTGYWIAENRGNSSNPDRNPLLEYIERKPDELLKPCRGFDPADYQNRLPEAVSLGLDPLAHVLKFGRRWQGQIGYGNRKPAEAHGALWEAGHPWLYKNPVPEGCKRLNLLLVAHELGHRLFGSERSLLELIETVDRDRFNIYCVFPQMSQQPCNGAITNIAAIEKVRPFAQGVALFFYRWWSGADGVAGESVSQFENILKSQDIDLVHVNTITLRDPLIAARRLGIPCVTHIREIIVHDEQLAARIGLPASEIAMDVVQRSDFLVSNSNHTQSYYPKPDRSFVVYNTADEKAFDFPVRPRGDLLKVAMLGSTFPKKGVADFFALARMALDRDAPLEFWLIGEPTEHLQALITSEGQPANLKLLPYVAEPATVLQNVDALVNLSYFAESFGRTVAEAMLARLPVVVYRHGALPELVDDGVTGFVVPYREPERVLEKLVKLATDSDCYSRMAEAARASALGKFSREAGRIAVGRVYDTILGSSIGEAHLKHKARRQIRAAKGQPRIAYCMWHFPVRSETFVLNELRELVRLGCDCRVYCRHSPEKDFRPDFPIEWEQVTSTEELAAKLRESKRDVVHSHFVYPTVTDWVWPACEAVGIPFTFIGHGQDVFRYKNIEKGRIGEIVRSPQCLALFTVGSFHRQLYLEAGAPVEKLVIRPQSVPLNQFEAQPLGPRLKAPRLSICAVNRFVEKKGMEVAIRGMSKLAPYGVSLSIYGYGPLEESLRALCAKLGLSNVHFPGSIDGRTQLVEVLRKHDMLVAPSVRATDGDLDGIPTCLMEAMASHVPVLASRISSIPDLVREGVTGYLCEPGDSQSFADAVLRFYNDPVARIESIVHAAYEAVGRFDVVPACRTLLRTWSRASLDVILVTYNKPKEIAEVINRLYHFTRTPFRLIIVDNASEPETVEFLREVERQRSNVTLLLQPENLFVGPGTNKGLEAGSAPVAVYLCSREGYILKEGWDQAILDFMDENPEVGLAGTLAYSPAYLTGKDYIGNLESFPCFRNREFAEAHRNRTFQHVQGGLIAIRRSMYEVIGGFSEATPHNHTDVEYSYYVESCGWKLGGIPDFAIVFNKTRPSLFTRIAENTMVAHPGTLETAATLDDVANCRTQFCSICGTPGVDWNASSEAACPACHSKPFHRTLLRYIAGTVFTYRGLRCLFVGQPTDVPRGWKDMFNGDYVTYEELFAEYSKKGAISHPDEHFDLIVMRVPPGVPMHSEFGFRSLERLERSYTASAGFFAELYRMLSPDGRLLYYRGYGSRSLLENASSDTPGLALGEIIGQLALNRFQTEEIVRYRSEVVRYARCAMLVCRKVNDLSDIEAEADAVLISTLTKGSG